jgi:hypothetical protein
MRNTIFILTLFLVAACNNKNDLKRIDELEKENKMISDSLTKQNKIIKLVYDSLVEKQANKIIGCQIVFATKVAISQPISKSIKINSAYKSKVFFLETLFSSSVLMYSIPSKERKFNQHASKRANIGSQPLEIPEYSLLDFTPKDTGWYYWNGEINERNDRTGVVTKYPIIDSFYVYQ